ncbi:hypothetical protein D3C87_2078160 [compost metagenome]
MPDAAIAIGIGVLGEFPWDDSDRLEVADFGAGEECRRTTNERTELRTGVVDEGHHFTFL